MNTAVAEREQTDTQAPAGQQAVAIFQPPRLPWHPAIEQRFGIDRSAWKALTDAVFPMAKTSDAVALALSYCKARKLDPFKRVVHIVPIWDSESRQYVETVWPGIAEHRTTAFRTNQYAGCDPASFGPTIEREFEGQTKQGQRKIKVAFPEWCQITVYRLVGGQRVAIPGPRVYWLETYSRIGRTDLPNDMWQKRASGQLEKCAEAAALRKAFPEELGGEATAEEMEGQTIGSDNALDVTPPARPTRAQFHDAETGEIIEPEQQQSNASPATDTPPAEAAADPGNTSDTGSAAQPSLPVDPPQTPPKKGQKFSEFEAEIRAALELCRDMAGISDVTKAYADVLAKLTPAQRDRIDGLIAARSDEIG